MELGKFTTEPKAVPGGTTYRPPDQEDAGRALDAKMAKAAENAGGREVKTMTFDPATGEKKEVPDTDFAKKGREGFSFKESQAAEGLQSFH